MGTEGNWGQPIVALTAFFLGLVIVTLALRIFTRVWIVHAFWWDDATIILAVLGTTIGAALDFVEVHYGFGTHQRFLTQHELQEFRKYTYGEWIQTFATLMWTKVSICLFLIRIPQSRALKRPLQWAVAFLLFSNTILTVLLIMQCQPIHAAWDDDGRCLSLSAKEGIVLAQAVISVVSDFAFAALPIFFLWRTQIDVRTKIGLWVLMGLGVLTGIFCLVRTVINSQSFPEDESYGGIVNWVWRLFEVSIGIIAACVPTLRPFYTWAKKRLRGEQMSGDRHIRFPLSGKPQPWVENVEEAKHARREDEKKTDGDMVRQSGMKSNERHGSRRDTLREELIREGIIDTHKSTHATPLPSTPENRNETSLGQEMQKYGINDSIV